MNKTCLILLLLFSPLFLNAQNTYEFYGKLGMSNLYEVNYSEYILTSESYDYAFSYDVGGKYVRSFYNNMFRAKAGLGFSSIATKMGIEVLTQDGSAFKSILLKSNYIVVPIEASYSFEKWMLLNVGLDQKVLITNELQDYTKYLISFNGGIDFKVYNNYLIGLNYNRDITPIKEMKVFDIFNYSNQFTLKLAYILN